MDGHLLHGGVDPRHAGEWYRPRLGSRQHRKRRIDRGHPSSGFADLCHHGGFGRRDNALSAEWTADRLGRQFDRDVDEMSDHLGDPVGRLGDEFYYGADGMRATYDLYLSGSAYPVTTRTGRGRENVGADE